MVKDPAYAIQHSNYQKKKVVWLFQVLKNNFYAAQIHPIFYWCTASYIAKWKDIETNIQDLQVQSFIGESEIHGHSKDKLGPIVTFSLKIWHSIVKHFKSEKEIGILRSLVSNSIPGGPQLCTVLLQP